MNFFWKLNINWGSFIQHSWWCYTDISKILINDKWNIQSIIMMKLLIILFLIGRLFYNSFVILYFFVWPKLYYLQFVLFFSAYGMSNDGHTTFVNAAICDKRYRSNNLPLIIDLVPAQKWKKKIYLINLKLYNWQQGNYFNSLICESINSHLTKHEQTLKIHKNNISMAAGFVSIATGVDTKLTDNFK